MVCVCVCVCVHIHIHSIYTFTYTHVHFHPPHTRTHIYISSSSSSSSAVRRDFTNTLLPFIPIILRFWQVYQDNIQCHYRALIDKFYLVVLQLRIRLKESIGARRLRVCCCSCMFYSCSFDGNRDVS